MRKKLKLMAILAAFGLTAWFGVVALAQGSRAPAPSTSMTTTTSLARPTAMGVKGNCDGAEHANDPECVGVNPMPEDNHENVDRGDVNHDDQGENDDDNDDQGENENDDQGADPGDEDQGDNSGPGSENSFRQIELGQRKLVPRASPRRRPYQRVRPPFDFRSGP
jgi:hypothetical protein